MGHRKWHSPKRGSLAFLPRKRAESTVGRIRYWPHYSGEPALLGFPGYKAGMTYIVGVDSRQGSLSFGKEIAFPCTVLEAPATKMVGIRVYNASPQGLRALGECWSKELPKELERVVNVPKEYNAESALQKIESGLDKIHEVRAIMTTAPRLAKIGKKDPEILEVKVGGGGIKEQFEYCKNRLGKEVSLLEVLKEGQWVDVVGITKGKGVQGPVKRWGVSILHHKSRKTHRGVGCIGPWHPHFVVYSVPRAGQMGFFQRTEYNKQIIKIGSDGGEVTVRGGFNRYGVIKNPYALVRGSLPGPAKRLLFLRYGARAERMEPTAPKIEQIMIGDYKK